jgi:hypothetical protein
MAGKLVQDFSLTASYGYDTLNRLTKSLATAWSDSCTYDSFGNLCQMAPVPSGGPESNLTATPTILNQLSFQGMPNVIKYDGAGNVIKDAADKGRVAWRRYTS